MKKLLYILILLTLISCEKQIDWQMDENINPRLVVEGMITNNPELNYVRLSLPVTSPDQDPVMLSGALVALVSGNGSIIMSETQAGTGYYTPETDITGVVGEPYRLYVLINEFEFLSNPVWMYPVYQLKELRYYELTANPQHFVINPVESNETSYIEYRVIYEKPDSPGDTLQNLFYSYTLRTLDVNQFFKPDSEWLVFPEGAMVIRTKYSLSPDHEKYIRSLLHETEWKGGWFDLSPGNLHTNMSAGAVGYFGACSALRDTVYLQ